jgi:hypothetical protein
MHRLTVDVCNNDERRSAGITNEMDYMSRVTSCAVQKLCVEAMKHYAELRQSTLLI